MWKHREEEQAKALPFFGCLPEGWDEHIPLPFLPAQWQNRGLLLMPLLLIKQNKLPSDIDVFKLPLCGVQKSLQEEASAEENQH